MVAGGDALARDADGRVVFVSGALPGERVRAAIVQSKKDFARAKVVDVLEASVWRVDAPCLHVERGCGGCQWQHIAPEGQRAFKRDVVRDALRRIGKVPDDVADRSVGETVTLPATGYRTTSRVVVRAGRAGFRRASSNEIVEVDSCLVAHPLLEELIRDGRFGGASEVELRVGARTGDRLALCDPTAGSVQLPDDVVVVGMDDLVRGVEASIEEEVAGRRWRISAASFFQIRPDGAEALVELVNHAAGDAETVADLYCGVGLFAGALAARGSVVAVEGDPTAVRDARHNLAELDAEVVEADVHEWQPADSYDLVVADPSRNGLGTRGVATILACEPARVVLLSCDPAALGRDAGLLAAGGFELIGVTPVDLFPHTVHIETVSTFSRE